MKRNLDTPILKIDGSEFAEKLTLKSVLFLSSTVHLPNDDRLDGNAKLKLYALAALVHKGGVADFTAEDITLLKERVGRAFAIEAVGRAYELLDKDYEPPVVGYEQQPTA